MYLSPVPNFPLFLQFIRTSVSGSRKARFSFTGMLPVKERLNYFIELKELLQNRKIKTVLDNHYPLAQMAEPHKYVEKGHKKGNVVITV